MRGIKVPLPPELNPHTIHATTERRKAKAAEDTSEEEEDGFVRVPWGSGLLPKVPPLRTRMSGKSRDFHDGFGLCSPGRW